MDRFFKHLQEHPGSIFAWGLLVGTLAHLLYLKIDKFLQLWLVEGQMKRNIALGKDLLKLRDEIQSSGGAGLEVAEFHDETKRSVEEIAESIKADIEEANRGKPLPSTPY